MSNVINNSSFPIILQSDIYLEQFLAQFGTSTMFSICIKDIKMKHVCLSNTVCEEFWGLPKDIIKGMNAREIFTRVANFSNVEEVLKHLEEREAWVIKNHCSTMFQQTLLSYDGFVQVRQSMLIPLRGIHNRFIAISGLGLNITHCIEPLQLLAYYRCYYSKSSEAASKFCAYFNLNVYFYRQLSYEELRTLLTMLKDCRHKQVATNLNISTKTVANYLFSIRIKLKEGIELYELISNLRVKTQFIIGCKKSNQFTE